MYNKNSKEGINVDDNIFTAQSNANTNKYMKCIQECMQLLCIIMVTIRCLKLQNSPLFLYIIMCSWIILGCNANACTCAKCADLDPKIQTVWNEPPVNTYDISNYTCGQIKYITAEGAFGDVICSNSADTITFQMNGNYPMRVLFGGGPIGVVDCCSSSYPRRICNAPDKQSDINELCKNLGYSSGTFTLRSTSNTCPEAHFANEAWTSDFIRSNGAITSFNCIGCGVPDPPEECDPTPCPTNAPSTAPSIPTLAPTLAPSVSTLAPSVSTLAPSVSTLAPSMAPSLSPEDSSKESIEDLNENLSENSNSNSDSVDTLNANVEGEKLYDLNDKYNEKDTNKMNVINIQIAASSWAYLILFLFCGINILIYIIYYWKKENCCEIGTNDETTSIIISQTQ